MLTQDEELWVKELPPHVEELIKEGYDTLSDRGNWRARAAASASAPSKPKTHKSEEEGAKAVTLRVPHNAAVQIYDYKQKKARSLILFNYTFKLLYSSEYFYQFLINGIID